MWSHKCFVRKKHSICFYSKEEVKFTAYIFLIYAIVLLELQGIDQRIIIEIFIEGGREFTAIVLDLGSGPDCSPVTLIPTEVNFL